jgi:uncharacterized protein (TIGR02246 family)
MATALSLEARVLRLEDEKEIRELLVEYGRRLDARDYRGYAQLFARDGEWIGGLGRASGPAAIEAMLEKGLGSAPAGYRNVSDFHVLTNFQIDVQGDEATAFSRILYMIKNEGNAPSPSRGGHYNDKFIREEGRWKFSKRVVFGDIPPQDPLTAISMPER